VSAALAPTESATGAARERMGRYEVWSRRAFRMRRARAGTLGDRDSGYEDESAQILGPQCTEGLFAGPGGAQAAARCSPSASKAAHIAA
jgi:hypothetical protein